MVWTLLLTGCTFVAPPQDPVPLEPSREVLEHIDGQRRRLQGTDAGAELWRSIDAHGGMLRYERTGPWTAQLTDGRTVGPGDPLHQALTRPFSWVDVAPDPSPPTIQDTVVLRTVEGERIELDLQRQVLGWVQDGDRYDVEGVRSVQGLALIASLAGPDGTHVEVERWMPAHPLPGWPLED